MYIYMYTYTYIYVYIHIRAYAYAYTYTYTYTDTDTYTYTYINIHISIYIYQYTYTYVYIHTCIYICYIYNLCLSVLPWHILSSNGISPAMVTLDLSGHTPKAHQHSGIKALLGYKAGKIILSANHLMGSWGRQTPDRKVWSPGDGHLWIPIYITDLSLW